jgi:hypothetical protein
VPFAILYIPKTRHSLFSEGYVGMIHLVDLQMYHCELANTCCQVTMSTESIAPKVVLVVPELREECWASRAVHPV